MKKNNIACLMTLLLPGILWLASCYDDKSSFATNPIPEVRISVNDVDQENTIRVGYQTPVDIVPSITQEGSDGSNLRYEWAVTEEPKTTNAVFEIIGTEKEFHGIINRPVAEGAYLLKLTVTDAANDNLQYIYSWRLYVQSEFLDGLLIADTEDGVTTDLTLINNSQITNQYTGEERIFRHIIETAGGTAYDGLLTSLTYEVMGNPKTASSLGSRYTNQVWAISSAGESVRFDCKDYSINGAWESDDLFMYRPAGFQVRSYFRSSQNFIAYANNGFYVINNTNANKFPAPNSVLEGCEINNNVYAANSSSVINDNHLVWLNDSTGTSAFRSLSGNISFPDGFICGEYVSGPEFDPNDMGDQTAIAAAILPDASLAVFLLKDNSSGEYAVYTLSPHVAESDDTPEQPAAARNKYSVPPEGKALLDKAVSVFFGHAYNVLYVATDAAVYAFTYGIGGVRVSDTPQFTPGSGEEITKAKLYQQGQYTNLIDFVEEGYITENKFNNKALVIVTQSAESGGKVSLVPMRQPGAGTLDASKALVYDGFGEILDVTATGY